MLEKSKENEKERSLFPTCVDSDYCIHLMETKKCFICCVLFFGYLFVLTHKKNNLLNKKEGSIYIGL